MTNFIMLDGNNIFIFFLNITKLESLIPEKLICVLFTYIPYFLGTFVTSDNIIRNFHKVSI